MIISTAWEESKCDSKKDDFTPFFYDSCKSLLYFLKIFIALLSFFFLFFFLANFYFLKNKIGGNIYIFYK